MGQERKDVNKGTFYAAGLTVAALLVGAGSVLTPVQADGQTTKPVTLRFAFIDVGKVLRNYEKTKTLSEALKIEGQKKEAEIRNADSAIQAKVNARQGLRKKEDIDRIDKELAEMKFNRDRMVRDYQDDLAKKEVEMLSTVYQEMSDLLNKYCKENGIHMVLRLRSPIPELPDNHPQNVQSMLDKTVVYSHENLDLTQVVSDGLNRQFGKR
jgi:Skp family chaperone for outer membrane proteins